MRSFLVVSFPSAHMASVEGWACFFRRRCYWWGRSLLLLLLHATTTHPHGTMHPSRHVFLERKTFEFPAGDTEHPVIQSIPFRGMPVSWAQRPAITHAFGSTEHSFQGMPASLAQRAAITGILGSLVSCWFLRSKCFFFPLFAFARCDTSSLRDGKLLGLVREMFSLGFRVPSDGRFLACPGITVAPGRNTLTHYRLWPLSP